MMIIFPMFDTIQIKWLWVEKILTKAINSGYYLKQEMLYQFITHKQTHTTNEKKYSIRTSTNNFNFTFTTYTKTNAFSIAALFFPNHNDVTQ